MDHLPPPSPDDPLEQELLALRPANLPSGVQRGIAAALSAPAIRPRRPSLVLRWATVGLTAAACVVGAVVVVRESGKPSVTPTGPTPPAVAESAPPAAPTLGEFRLALARSPEAAEALLAGGGGAKQGANAAPRAFGAVASSAWPADLKY